MSYICLSISVSERLLVNGETVSEFGRSIAEFGRRFGHEIRLAAAQPDPDLIRRAEVLICVTESCSTELAAELEIAQDSGTPAIVCLPARQYVPRSLWEIPMVVEIYRWSVLASAHDYVRAVVAHYRSPFAFAVGLPADGEPDNECYWVDVAPSIH